MTPAEIIYHRRVRLLSLADELGNVAEACRQMGISRTRYYEWRRRVEQYGLEALMPKARRSPQLPNATPIHVVEELLTLAVTVPTIGCRQYADRLAERGYVVSKTTVQKLLVDHGLVGWSAMGLWGWALGSRVGAGEAGWMKAGVGSRCSADEAEASDPVEVEGSCS